MIDLDKIKKVHFAGAGGIGVSALCRLFLNLGKTVSGSDLAKSEITDELSRLGAKIFIGHKATNLDNDVELFIFTPALDETNPELAKAKQLGIPTLSYPQTLGLVSKNHSLIAISGTHGKTTTTAMLSKVLIDANFDPTVIVGSLFKKTKTNCIIGKGKYFIAEACEYKRSFLNLDPHILIITNIDLDHLDYYKDLADIQNAFSELTAELSKNDYLICDIEHKNLKPIIAVANCKIIDYKTFSDEDLELKIPGEHNIENATAVLATADILKIDRQKVGRSLNAFEGTWRRFEYKGKTRNGTAVYDDYAHNPAEVKATLKGAREFFPGRKITVVFQPHLYSRTKIFLKKFARAFGDADQVIILPIYAAREKNDESVNSEMLVGEIEALTYINSSARRWKNKVFPTPRSTSLIKKQHKNVVYSPNFDLAVEKTKKLSKGDILITMGAGDVWKVGEMFLSAR